MVDIDEIWKTGYADALERVEELFNQLCSKKRIGEACRDCPLIPEIEKMRILVKNDQFNKQDKELGYHLY